jgi:hypothetical protein
MTDFLKTAGYILWPIAEAILTFLVPVLVAVAIQSAVKLLSYLSVASEQKKTEMERQLNTALHTAFERAIKMAMLRYGITPDILSKMIDTIDPHGSVKSEEETINDMIDLAINGYVRPNMAETIDKLGVSDKVLRDIAKTKIIGAAKN